MSLKLLVPVALVAAFAGLSATPASAGTGCNGIINPFVWGCAPWDNNNGAQYPYFKKKTVQVPASQVKVENKNGVNVALYNGSYYPMVAAGGGNMVAAGGGNVTILMPN